MITTIQCIPTYPAIVLCRRRSFMYLLSCALILPLTILSTLADSAAAKKNYDDASHVFERLNSPERTRAIEEAAQRELAAEEARAEQKKQPDSADAVSSTGETATAAPPAATRTNAAPETNNEPVTPTPPVVTAAASDMEILKELSVVIEQWRKTWEEGDLEGYLAAYAPSAMQPPRKGLEAIKRYKQKLWLRNAPAEVSLSDIEISRRGETVKAVMHQTYKDALGGGDKGVKILVFKKIGETWRIVEETWKPAP